MLRRRSFLAMAAATLAAPAWGATGIRFLTAANTAANDTVLLALSERGDVLAQIPLPSRGHAACAHPSRSLAVAFARRPGRFAVVLNVATGAEVARLQSPEGRHFYGHGAFTADGRHLLTTENAYDSGDGRLGVWELGETLRRIDDLPSGGVGPHEIIRLRSGGFAVANGGIQTHPDRGRAKLNLPTMAPNLTWLTGSGEIEAVTPHGAGQRLNSIRHIAADTSDRLAIALQWQGNPLDAAPVAAVADKGEAIQYLEHPETARLKHYGGSVALSGDHRQIGITGPKGSHLLRFDAQSLAPLPGMGLPTASGLAPDGAGFAVTTRDGLVHLGSTARTDAVPGGWAFDNHLLAV